MGRTRDVSKILTSNTSILSLASASSIYQTIATTGLVEITPPTISTTGGSGSISATGVVSFTSASAISLNDVFSTTYTNYKIIINAVGTTEDALNFRYRVSGSDNSTSNYQHQIFQADNTSLVGARNSGVTQTLISRTNSNTVSTSLEIFNPFATERTQSISNSIDPASNTTMRIIFGIFNATTSFTGFTVIAASGNITGSVSVYGYNK
jgi:hypothetical protein